MRWLIIGLVVALMWRPAAAAPDRPLRLKFAGDVMFGRYGPRGLVPIAAERRDPFATVRRLLASDLTLVNLETPIARRPPRRIAPPTRNRFAATPARVARLRRAGVDAVTVANNPAEDLGVADTAAVLAALGLAAFGTTTAEEPAVRVESIARAGWTIAIVAVTTVRNRSAIAGQPHLPYLPPDRLAATVAPRVAAARRDHDAVVVAVHWGTEHATAPDPEVLAEVGDRGDRPPSPRAAGDRALPGWRDRVLARQLPVRQPRPLDPPRGRAQPRAGAARLPGDGPLRSDVDPVAAVPAGHAVAAPRPRRDPRDRARSGRGPGDDVDDRADPRDHRGRVPAVITECGAAG